MNVKSVIVNLLKSKKLDFFGILQEKIEDWRKLRSYFL